MVSISSVGKVFNTPIKFNANPTNTNKQTDKETLKAFAQNQVNLGYGVMTAGAIALAGTLAKTKSVRAIATIPAALIATSMGINMLNNGKAIQKEVEQPLKVQEPKEPKEPKQTEEAPKSEIK